MNAKRTNPVLYDMSRKDYKNVKMKLKSREKIGLKLFSTRQILSRESTFLCQQPMREKKKSNLAGGKRLCSIYSLYR